MTKSQAIFTFWSGFGYPVYDETTVPIGDEAPEFPYITFNYSSREFGDGTPLTLTASFWDRSSSWAKCEQIADTVGAVVSTMRPIQCDNGYVWIRQGSPFAQRMGDPNDDMIRRMLFTLDVKFITTY